MYTVTLCFIDLVQAPDEDAWNDFSVDTQSALLRAGALPSDSDFHYQLPDLAKAVVPALCTALGYWLASHNNRKVRIRIGDIEAEAQTKEEVVELLDIAQRKQQEIQQRNQPPKIIP